MRKITQADIDAAYNFAAGAATSIINAGDEAVPQLIFIQIDDVVDGKLGKIALVLIDDDSYNDREALRALIESVLVGKATAALPDFRPDIAVQVNEAWQAAYTGKRRDDDLEPSQRPDRVEVLTVIVHVAGYTYAQFSPITTNAGGLRHCEVVPMAYDVTLGGRMVQQQGERH